MAVTSILLWKQKPWCRWFESSPGRLFSIIINYLNNELIKKIMKDLPPKKKLMNDPLLQKITSYKELS